MKLANLLPLAAAGTFLLIGACDGSGISRNAGTEVPEPTTPEVEQPTEITPDEELTPGVKPFDVGEDLDPVAPIRRPLPSGTTEGATLVVSHRDLKGRFLYGIGANPDGGIGQLGGGAAGIAPLRAVVVLVPEEETEGGILEIRVWDTRTESPMPGDDGLIASYPYADLDDDTVRIDFSQPQSSLEIAVYGSCRFVQSSFELEQPPMYADGLLTWPARETYQRSGQCQWVPRSTSGVHVHYLRHELAGRDFVPQPRDADAVFGFFLAGDHEAPLLARMPGIDPREPPITHTYYLVDFPWEFIPAAQATFDAWNDALEEITGRRPFEMALAPEDLIAWDPRYHAVVFDDSDDSFGAGAVAPFTEDPDTGEIFQSLVVMWFGDLGNTHESYAKFFERHPDVADLLLEPLPGDGGELPRFEGFDRNKALSRPFRPADVAPRVLTTRPFAPRELRITDIPAELWREATTEELNYIITVDFLLHEIGHNLGLRHNFIASVDKHRHSPAHSATSTMDYVIGMLDPGSYDRDAMRYAYGESGPKYTDYLYCTDETLDLDPACIPWDYGNPVRYELDLIGRYFAAITPDSSDREVDRALRDLSEEFSRVRRFVNTDYEKWDEPVIDTFVELLTMVDCAKDCTMHTALRSELALYLLYTRFVVTATWEEGYPNVWMEFPALTATQAALLMDTYFSIVVGRDEPFHLKSAIINKLPTSAVDGAAELLERLKEHFDGLSALNGDEADVKAAVEAALASL